MDQLKWKRMNNSIWEGEERRRRIRKGHALIRLKLAWNWNKKKKGRAKKKIKKGRRTNKKKSWVRGWERCCGTRRRCWERNMGKKKSQNVREGMHVGLVNLQMCHLSHLLISVIHFDLKVDIYSYHSHISSPFWLDMPSICVCLYIYIYIYIGVCYNRPSHFHEGLF